MVRFRWSSGLLMLGLAASCSTSELTETELVLVADTNIPNVDTIQFEVMLEGSAATKKQKGQPVKSGTPTYLTLLRDEGPLGPLLVTARAMSGNTVRLSRTQRVSFVPQQSNVVELHLLEHCIALACPESCDETGCIDLDVDSDDLSPWTGTAPHIHMPQVDGGIDPAPADAGAQLSGDAGADAATGFYCGASAGWVDLESDPANCGYCGRDCPSGIYGTNAVGACKKHECAYACAPGWGNCDGIVYYYFPVNGCEQNLLSSTAHCGACNHACASGQSCREGVCVTE